jgi:Amt family ammonium transporter
VLNGGDLFNKKEEVEEVAIDKVLPVFVSSNKDSTNKLTKVDVVCNESKAEALKDCLASIGITGMTVSNVMGYGIQGGHTTYYRGAKLKTNLLPKVRFEIVISEIQQSLL